MSPCVCRSEDIWLRSSPYVILQVPLAAAYLPPALLLALPYPQARDLVANLPPSPPLTDGLQRIHALEQGIMVGAGSLVKWGGGME